jgi:hypothetical protein
VIFHSYVRLPEGNNDGNVCKAIIHRPYADGLCHPLVVEKRGGNPTVLLIPCSSSGFL